MMVIPLAAPATTPAAPQPLAGFRRSSFCSDGMCVEVAADSGGILVRDTKDPSDGPVLRFTTQEWIDFLSGVAAGEFTPAVLAISR